MNNATLINQTSGDVEYFTDMRIIEAARQTMGSIELDPASSKVANTRIKAGRYFDMETDGLQQEWRAETVWLNWPFGRVENPAWVQKLTQEWFRENFNQACVITYACTSEKWFQPLLAKPQVFLHPRTNYYLPDGSLKRGVTKGSVVTYYGKNVTAFKREFSPFGVIKVAL